MLLTNSIKGDISSPENESELKSLVAISRRRFSMMRIQISNTMIQVIALLTIQILSANIEPRKARGVTKEDQTCNLLNDDLNRVLDNLVSMHFEHSNSHSSSLSKNHLKWFTVII